MSKSKLFDISNGVKYEEQKTTNADHVATPRWVVEHIYGKIHIERFEQVWLPFNNYDSQFKLKAEELKLQYHATHLFDDLGNDFLTTLPPSGCDLMISNPPWSIQNKIIERSLWLVEQGLIKSFCLLLPLATLETPTRGNMWERYKDKLSVIVFKKRIKFIGHSSGFNKGCCWVCYNIEDMERLEWV